MKKKIAALGMIGMFVLGGAVSAATSYYVDVLNGRATSVKGTIDERIKDEDKLIYNDTMSFVGTEGERMESEALGYLDEQLAAHHREKLNANSAEVTAAADQKIAELKTYIDEKIRAQK